MSIIEAIILGIIQGLTEFIPVSSSGHLVAAQNFLTGASDHLFIEFINFGTILALVIYFWPKLTELARQVFVDRDYKLARNIMIAVIPAGLVGFFAAEFIENTPFFGNVWVTIVMLVLLGIVMIVLEKLPRASFVPEGRELSPKRALAIGLAQVLAFIPGTSRSGSTIVAGRLLGMKPAAAAEFSFLVSIPLMSGLVLKLLMKEGDRMYMMDNLSVVFMSNLAAFVAGLLAVGLLMRFLARHSLSFFGWYRIGLAGLLAVILLI
jgi:undecaprenyl-diphosphatase